MERLERRLGGWMPRPPSQRIEEAIFFRRPCPESDRPGLIPGLRLWQRLLGPVGAFGLVLLVSLSTVSGIATDRRIGEVSNHAWEYKPVYHHSVLNHCDYPIFGWTNLSLPAEGIALFAADPESRTH